MPIGPSITKSYQLKRRRLLILIGNFIEHFDAALYGFCAPLIAHYFFPSDDPLSQLIVSYGLYTVSLVSRPLGAYYFSKYAQHQCIYKLLSVTLMGIGSATLLFGFVPLYSHAGKLSLLYLIACRLFQGFFAGGETSLAPLALIEIDPQRSSFHISFYSLSTILGIMAASLSVQLIGYYPALDLLWRILFIVGGLFAILCGLLRNFYYPKQYILKSIKINKISFKNKINAFTLTGTCYYFYSFPFIFLPNFFSLITSFTYKKISFYNSGLLLMDGLLGILIGLYSDRFNRKNYLKFFLLGYILCLPLIVYLISLQTIISYLSASLIIIIIGVCINDQVIPYLRNCLHMSYQQLSITNAISAESLGKMTPLFCLYLFKTSQSLWLPFSYGLLLCSISYLTFDRKNNA